MDDRGSWSERGGMTDTPITVHDLPELVLAAPLMLGYWPEQSVCAVVVDPDGRVLLIMRWGADEPEVSVPPPLAERGDAMTVHHVAYVGSSGGGDAPSWDQPYGMRVSGRPALVACREGADVRFRATTGGESGWQRITAIEIATTARRWARPAWLANREEYTRDIDDDPVLREQVSARLAVLSGAIDEGQREAAIARVLATLASGPMDATALADTLVALQDTRVRDTVLWEFLQHDPGEWDAMADRLATAVSGAPPERLAPPATLLAILRWQTGDGSRAAAAVDRALAADPGYTLAGLVLQCLLTGMHPLAWREGMAGLTREECRRSA